MKSGITYAHAPATALSHVVALRLHFDDSREDNGPLRVLPRTHALGVLSEADTERLVQEIPPVDCLVSSGGHRRHASAHTARVVQSGNRSSTQGGAHRVRRF